MPLRLHTGSPPLKAQIWEKQAGFILIKLFSEARVSHKREICSNYDLYRKQVHYTEIGRETT